MTLIKYIKIDFSAIGKIFQKNNDLLLITAIYLDINICYVDFSNIISDELQLKNKKKFFFLSFNVNKFYYITSQFFN